MKNKKGFTLIELLAIIVILAIIAVITVPIVANIRKQAQEASIVDSAYGYVDAVNKLYFSNSLNNNTTEIDDGTYTVAQLKTLGITVNGREPSEGCVVLEDGNVSNYSLKFGDYAVNYNSTNKTAVAEKDGELNIENGICTPSVPSVPTIASCPGCRFIYTTSALTVGPSNMPDESITTTDYRTLIGEGGHPYFLGLIESTTNPGKIGRGFVCGIEKDSNNNDVPFCLEGKDPTKWSNDANVGVLNTIFPECNADASDSSADCIGSSVVAYASGTGSVNVYDDYAICYVNYNGPMGCRVL